VPDPVSLLASATAPPAARPAPPPGTLGKDAFLQLLVAQLRHQNPMSPMDGADFIAQTAQLTMVEKIEELARTSADALADNRSLGAAGLVGRQVSYVAPDGESASGVVSAARFGPAGVSLVVDGQVVPLAALTEVRPGTAPAPPATTGAPSPDQS
jgi:flagellar basal-body rod modification protein FlgD